MGSISITNNSYVFSDNDGKTVTYTMTWLAPDGVTTGSITRNIATLEVYTVPTLVDVIEASAGSPNVQVIGKNLNETYVAVGRDKYGICYGNHGPNITLAASDHDKTYQVTVKNACGTATKFHPIKINLEYESRGGKKYYAGLQGQDFRIIRNKNGRGEVTINTFSWTKWMEVWYTNDVFDRYNVNSEWWAADRYDATVEFSKTHRGFWILDYDWKNGMLFKCAEGGVVKPSGENWYVGAGQTTQGGGFIVDWAE